MTDSILTSIKNRLGIAPSETVFDDDLLMDINSAFTDLAQLGIGPTGGFSITGADETWVAFFDPSLGLMESVKTYVYLKVRLIFDPPATSFAIASMERQIDKLEWRINVQREEATWVPPETPPTSSWLITE